VCHGRSHQVQRCREKSVSGRVEDANYNAQSRT
jgi:hypothetical protein